MFFLLPKVTLVLLIVFGCLVGLRLWRQRHAQPRPPRPRRRRLRPPRRAGTGDATTLLPAGLLKGADRTWVVFMTPDSTECRGVADRLRAARLGAEVAEVDCEGQPQLAEAFAIRRVPTVLLANRYGQVESRLVGARAIGRAIDATV
jgi:hypothetical protein